jgi:hypothetical protein
MPPTSTEAMDDTGRNVARRMCVGEEEHELFPRLELQPECLRETVVACVRRTARGQPAALVAAQGAENDVA